jgi:hypothetical protein
VPRKPLPAEKPGIKTAIKAADCNEVKKGIQDSPDQISGCPDDMTRAQPLV